MDQLIQQMSSLELVPKETIVKEEFKKACDQKVHALSLLMKGKACQSCFNDYVSIIGSCVTINHSGIRLDKIEEICDLCGYNEYNPPSFTYHCSGYIGFLVIIYE